MGLFNCSGNCYPLLQYLLYVLLLSNSMAQILFVLLIAFQQVRKTMVYYRIQGFVTVLKTARSISVS